MRDDVRLFVFVLRHINLPGHLMPNQVKIKEGNGLWKESGFIESLFVENRLVKRFFRRGGGTACGND